MARGYAVAASGTNVRFRGVRKRPRGKWGAEIWDSGAKRHVWLGTFNSMHDAAQAYDTAARRLRGHKAKTNFPSPPPPPPPRYSPSIRARVVNININNNLMRYGFAPAMWNAGYIRRYQLRMAELLCRFRYIQSQFRGGGRARCQSDSFVVVDQPRPLSTTRVRDLDLNQPPPEDL